MTSPRGSRELDQLLHEQIGYYRAVAREYEDHHALQVRVTSTSGPFFWGSGSPA